MDKAKLLRTLKLADKMRGANKWEKRFLKDIRRRIQAEEVLTEKQLQCLLKIATKGTSAERDSKNFERAQSRFYSKIRGR